MTDQEDAAAFARKMMDMASATYTRAQHDLLDSMLEALEQAEMHVATGLAPVEGDPAQLFAFGRSMIREVRAKLPPLPPGP